MKFLVIFGAFVAMSAALPHELSHGYKVEVKHDISHHSYPIKHHDEYAHNHHAAALIHEPVGDYHHHHDDHKDYYAYPKYKFEYGVKDPHTGDHKSQWEVRDGDVVKGEYTLDEADGTKRVVSYEASDKTGFNAVVKKIGHAAHPQKHAHVHTSHHGYDY